MTRNDQKQRTKALKAVYFQGEHLSLDMLEMLMRKVGKNEKQIGEMVP